MTEETKKYKVCEAAAIRAIDTKFGWNFFCSMHGPKKPKAPEFPSQMFKEHEQAQALET